MSRPPRARGLKQYYDKAHDVYKVAPPAGAWIETEKEAKLISDFGRAPRGARGLKRFAG